MLKIPCEKIKRNQGQKNTDEMGEKMSIQVSLRFRKYFGKHFVKIIKLKNQIALGTPKGGRIRACKYIPGIQLFSHSQGTSPLTALTTET